MSPGEALFAMSVAYCMLRHLRLQYRHIVGRCFESYCRILLAVFLGLGRYSASNGRVDEPLRLGCRAIELETGGYVCL